MEPTTVIADRPDAAPRLIAYHLPGRTEVDIVPAARWRAWMDNAEERWPNRCLPLLMANESGWWLRNPYAFTAIWDGTSSPSAVVVTLDDPDPGDALIGSVFGYGIITWAIPYLFRTDPGWNLLARGPANEPKDGVAPLEGLVESDWSTATFTMSWKLTRPDLPVRFESGEPFCAIVPAPRRDLEAFEPRKARLDEEGKLEQAFREWERRRDRLLALGFVSQFGTLEGFDRKTWQTDYFKGQTVEGDQAPDHQTTRRLRPFAEPAHGDPARHRA